MYDERQQSKILIDCGKVVTIPSVNLLTDSGIVYADDFDLVHYTFGYEIKFEVWYMYTDFIYMYTI